MSWLALVIAILLEVAGTTGMKLSEGFTRPLYGVLMFGFYAGSFTSMTFAIRNLDVSVAYAIWAGLGTAIIACLGIVIFKEPATAAKFLALGLIVAGIVLLNLTGAKH